MKIYITTDQNSVVNGWGSTRGSESDIEIEVEEESKILLSPSHFKYVNGEIIERTQEEIESTTIVPEPSEIELLKAENEKIKQENEKLKQESELNALAIMELTEIVLGG